VLLLLLVLLLLGSQTLVPVRAQNLCEQVFVFWLDLQAPAAMADAVIRVWPLVVQTTQSPCIWCCASFTACSPGQCGGLAGFTDPWNQS
jgi:hypothetical protein